MLSAEQMKTLKQVNVSKDPNKTKQRVKQDFSKANNAQKREIEALSAQKRHSFYRAYNTGSINARLVLAMAQALNVTPYYYTGEEDVKKPLDEKTMQSFLKDHGYDMLSDTPVKAKKGRPAKAKVAAAKEPAKEAVKKEATAPAKETVKKEAKAPAKETVKKEAKAPAKAKKAASAKRTKKAVKSVAPAPKTEPVKPAAPASAQSFVIHLTLPDSPKIQKVVDNMTEDDAVALLRAMLIREKTGQEAGQLAVLIKRCLLG